MAKLQQPRLDNVTDGALIDELAKLSIIENYAKGMRKFYREALLGRLGVKPFEALPNNVVGAVFVGETFSANITRTYPQRISSDLVKAEFPDDWQRFCDPNAETTTVRTDLKEGATNPVIGELMESLKKELGLED
jgi:hypothetical protein